MCYSSSYRSKEDSFITNGDGGGGVGNMTTHSSSNIVHLAERSMMRGHAYLVAIAQHSLWCHILVHIIMLNLPMYSHSVLMIDMVESVLVLGPPTSSPRVLFYILVDMVKSQFILVLRGQKTPTEYQII